MNEARNLYLWGYHRLDNNNHMLSNKKIITRKWWHSLDGLGREQAAVITHQIYLDLVTALNPDWFVEEKERISFGVWCHRQYRGLMAYDPKKGFFTCDGSSRLFRQQNQNQQAHSANRDPFEAVGSRRRRRPSSVSKVGKVSGFAFADALESCRLCTSIEELRGHIISHALSSGKGKCKSCGENTLTRCKICNVPLHFGTSQKGDKVGDLSCAVDYHNIEYFGLAFCDHTLLGITADDWKAPTEQERIENINHIRSLMAYHAD